ncbi:MAG TPA: Hsp20/alpha crystallin family protein [Dehalococcoidia bacterium]|nr:Hsp20/alpha crystallin family protein [Dehalococcoidia bacterium]
MPYLIRRDPFADLSTTMERLFESGFSRPWRLMQMGEDEPSIPLEVRESEDEIEVRAALPGVKPEDIDVSVMGNMVTIKADVREETADQQKTYSQREFQYGHAERSLTLRTEVDAEHTEASYQNGILDLHLHKAEAAKPKRIQVTGGDGKNVIEQSGSEVSQETAYSQE